VIKPLNGVNGRYFYRFSSLFFCFAKILRANLLIIYAKYKF
jgi:hypothetical protein